MVNIIPNEIMFRIFELSENKNLIYLDKSFNNYIKLIRINFVNKIKNRPIKINYQLIRWKEKYKENFKYRPSMCVEPERIFNLDINNLGLNIGYLNDNNINFTKDFEDQVVPTSYIKEVNPYIHYTGYVTYWTIRSAYTEDIELFKEYCLLN